ncbi:MAG TPA: phosphate ABC transporter substrate-binding protein PstS [Polyangiaceae bacterium]|jgi:phosphate transport system substrate-binding protein|nr:phosphate ABC transporter substrate-binding protein PstS [Polyangiaceae bacterium]
MNFGRRVLLLLPIFGLCACNKTAPDSAQGAAPGSASATPAAPKEISLTGAGATFPYPLYSKWMSEYNKLNPSVRINYQSIGSGGGIRQIVAGTVDFGASDAPMKPEEAKDATGKLLHIPTTIGAVVITYNLPEVSKPLKLSADLVAAIFLGDVKKWSDTKIAASNPGVKLPDKDIAVAYRSDGSGTTAVFTDYLVKVSPTWKDKVGAGKSVKWPVGLGAKGNEGVTGQVKTTPGSVGYVELAYATQNKLPMAELQNKAGKFVAPSIDGASAAAASAEMPDELHVSITDSTGEAAYPIASYTYLLVYEDAKDPSKGEALAKFLWWAIHDGQKFSGALDYAPVPDPVVKKIEARLKTLKSGGKVLLSGV